MLSFSSIKPPEETILSHSASLAFPLLTDLQASPEPSIIPPPVMDMFTAPSALTGEMHRFVSRPSKTVSTMSYSSLSGEKRTTASEVI